MSVEREDTTKWLIKKRKNQSQKQDTIWVYRPLHRPLPFPETPATPDKAADSSTRQFLSQQLHCIEGESETGLSCSERGAGLPTERVQKTKVLLTLLFRRSLVWSLNLFCWVKILFEIWELTLFLGRKAFTIGHLSLVICLWWGQEVLFYRF